MASVESVVVRAVREELEAWEVPELVVASAVREAWVVQVVPVSEALVVPVGRMVAVWGHPVVSAVAEGEGEGAEWHRPAGAYCQRFPSDPPRPGKGGRSRLSGPTPRWRDGASSYQEIRHDKRPWPPVFGLL